MDQDNKLNGKVGILRLLSSSIGKGVRKIIPVDVPQEIEVSKSVIW
jgi:hypothetical protein